jgi:hypothetical protein
MRGIPMLDDAAPSLPNPSSPDYSRRSFLTRAASLGIAAALPASPLAALRAGSKTWTPTKLEPRADAVIQIYLGGGLSHIDTFDPKPDAPIDVRGPFRTIPTNVDDQHFSELCRQLAKVADKLTVLRAVSHTEAAHERGAHNMLTGYRPSPAIVYPSFGSVVSHELGVRNNLPPYVCIPNANLSVLGTGYLSSAYGAFSIGSEPSNSGFSVKDLGPEKALDEERVKRRRQMLEELDAGFSGTADGVRATRAFYDQAWRLIDSPDAQEAFKIEREKKATRDRYGRTAFGQRLLLARRLVAAGVRYVSIPYGGWDNHENISSSLRLRMPKVDQALAALISDLDQRSMLDRTMVVLSTEFGRTPRINSNRGRDHWPRAFSVIAAGGGLKRGHFYGNTDANGSAPESGSISPADLAATMFTQLGIDPSRRLMSPGDRPIDIVRDGRLVRDLLA